MLQATSVEKQMMDGTQYVKVGNTVYSLKEQENGTIPNTNITVHSHTKMNHTAPDGTRYYSYIMVR